MSKRPRCSASAARPAASAVPIHLILVEEVINVAEASALMAPRCAALSQRLRFLRRITGARIRKRWGGASTSGRALVTKITTGHVPHVVIVQKYGGTSVASAARIRRGQPPHRRHRRARQQVVAVVSAMGHTTDRLIALAQSVNAEPPARELDMLVANGETITAPLVAMCLQGMGVAAVSLSGAQAGVQTSGPTRAAPHPLHQAGPHHGCAQQESQVPVVAAFRA